MVIAEVEKMGRIYDALRPYLPEFCELVDPLDLMRQLSASLRRCDLVGDLVCTHLRQYFSLHKCWYYGLIFLQTSMLLSSLLLLFWFHIFF